jgi:MFS family permease
MSSFSLGAGGASFLAGKIIPLWGWRALFLSAGIALIVAVYVYYFVPEFRGLEGATRRAAVP